MVKQKRGHGVVDPGELKDCIAKTAKKFESNRQEDAHEFFAEVLEVLSNELADHSEDPLKAAERRSKHETKMPLSPVAVNFQMVVQNVVTCRGCQHSLENQSVHRDISVDIPDIDFELVSRPPFSSSPAVKPRPQYFISCDLDINSLMRLFFESEEVEHTCEECKHDRAIFSHVIKSLPRVLVVHLKRFKVNTDKMTYEKLALPIHINRTLDLGEFCSIDALPPVPSPIKKIDPRRPSGEFIDVTSFYSSPLIPAHLNGASSSKRKLFEDEEEVLTEAEQLKRALAASLHDDYEDDMKKAVKNSMKDSGMAVSQSPSQSQSQPPPWPPEQQALSGHSQSLDDVLPLRGAKRHAGFTLHSVVSHIGQTAHNGHYVCDVLDDRTKKWKCYNDSLMSEVGDHEALNHKRKQMGYLFFYLFDGAHS